MKKIFSTVLASVMMLAGTSAFAQISVGAGYINSTLSGKSSSPTISNGFYAGASFDMPLPMKGLTFTPGAYLSLITGGTQGTLSVFGLNLLSGKTTFSELALNVPAMLNYGYKLSGKSKVFAYAGPTFQLGLLSRTAGEASGIFSNSGVRDHYSSGDFNRFNVYLGGGLGLEYSRIQFIIGYDYGLLNLYTGSGDSVINRANLHIGLGFAL